MPSVKCKRDNTSGKFTKAKDSKAKCTVKRDTGGKFTKLQQLVKLSGGSAMAGMPGSQAHDAMIANSSGVSGKGLGGGGCPKKTHTMPDGSEMEGETHLEGGVETRSGTETTVVDDAKAEALRILKTKDEQAGEGRIFGLRGRPVKNTRPNREAREANPAKALAATTKNMANAEEPTGPPPPPVRPASPAGEPGPLSAAPEATHPGGNSQQGLSMADQRARIRAQQPKTDPIIADERAVEHNAHAIAGKTAMGLGTPLSDFGIGDAGASAPGQGDIARFTGPPKGPTLDAVRLKVREEQEKRAYEASFRAWGIRDIGDRGSAAQQLTAALAADGQTEAAEVAETEPDVQLGGVDGALPIQQDQPVPSVVGNQSFDHLVRGDTDEDEPPNLTALREELAGAPEALEEYDAAALTPPVDENQFEDASGFEEEGAEVEGAEEDDEDEDDVRDELVDELFLRDIGDNELESDVVQDIYDDIVKDVKVMEDGEVAKALAQLAADDDWQKRKLKIYEYSSVGSSVDAVLESARDPDTYDDPTDEEEEEDEEDEVDRVLGSARDPATRDMAQQRSDILTEGISDTGLAPRADVASDDEDDEEDESRRQEAVTALRNVLEDIQFVGFPPTPNIAPPPNPSSALPAPSATRPQRAARDAVGRLLRETEDKNEGLRLTVRQPLNYAVVNKTPTFQNAWLDRRR